MRKFLRIVKYFALACAGVFFIALAIVLIVSVRRPEVQNAEAGVILGAGVYSPALYNRTLEGLEVYQKGKVQSLVLTGGQTNPKRMSEAEYMFSVITAHSSSSVPVVFENSSASTYENFKNTKALIPNIKDIVIISDCYHLARATLTARHFGFNVVSTSCPSPSYYPKDDLIYLYFREAAGLISYTARLPFME
jgi:uncharacterized SAM-binding protein YcdF (DUF218 family)